MPYNGLALSYMDTNPSISDTRLSVQLRNEFWKYKRDHLNSHCWECTKVIVVQCLKSLILFCSFYFNCCGIRYLDSTYILLEIFQFQVSCLFLPVI